MPKSKGDVSREIRDNREMTKQISEGIKDSSEKETRGKSGKFSGMGESSKKS